MEKEINKPMIRSAMEAKPIGDPGRSPRIERTPEETKR
jgi:hypothetical protein